ncbi:hypothetical protein, partial [Gottfriedia luciferensis]|uniref:hypothetical protein n=1 Tax=Gottfriedia luciferensis TaxID=178774 RepID=UPI001ABF3FED
DSYGKCGKAKDPAGLPRRLRFRPMESEHPVVEMNIAQLPLRNSSNYLTRLFFNSVNEPSILIDGSFLMFSHTKLSHYSICISFFNFESFDKLQNENNPPFQGKSKRLLLV